MCLRQAPPRTLRLSESWKTWKCRFEKAFTQYQAQGFNSIDGHETEGLIRAALLILERVPVPSEKDPNIPDAN